MSESTENNKYAALAVWIPLATAAIYFYCWVFEYASCTSLHIPADFIQPTTSTILFYVGTVVVFISILGLILTLAYICLKDTKLIAGIIALVIITIIFNIFYLIKNSETSWKIFWRLSKYALYCWVPVFVFWLSIHIFGNRKTWEKIFDFTFVDGKDVLSSLIKKRRKIYLSITIIGLVLVSWGIGRLFVPLNPPNQRILGKEPLVLLKKYDNVVICAYLDTVHNQLTDPIKIIKLGDGQNLTLRTINPAPSLAK